MKRLAICLTAYCAALSALATTGLHSESNGQAVAEPARKRGAAETPRPDADDEQSAPTLGEKWVRVVRDKRDHPLAMETAIVRYVQPLDFASGKPADAYTTYVDLVGAVHIGDPSYYRRLNQRFRSYDAVLYELVAPEGTVVPLGRGTSNSHPLGAMQNGMKSMLEIEHQLEQIDYTRPNFVHADLSPDQFLESMERRDEGFVEMYFRMLGASIAQQSQQSAKGESADLDIMLALFSDDRARKLKIVLAKQFEKMESLMLGLSGPNGSTLITERNTKALDVLETELGAGKKRLAIFYGAGHLAEMHDQIAKRFDLRPVGVEWIEAWDLREK